MSSYSASTPVGTAALSAAARAQGILLSARAVRAESSITTGSGGFDAVIVDPPRRGLSPDLRRQIASGNYDTPDKMDAALSRFLDGFA